MYTTSDEEYLKDILSIINMNFITIEILIIMNYFYTRKIIKTSFNFDDNSEIKSYVLNEFLIYQ